jgi:hypothetical protein
MNEKKIYEWISKKETKRKKNQLTAALPKITVYFNSDNCNLLPSKL